MKNAVILAAGAGSRAWPYSVLRPKVMFPLANIPIVEWSVRDLRAMGFTSIFIVAGSLAEQVENHFRSVPEVRVVRHDSPVRGTAASLSSCAGLLGEAPFVVVNGDTVYERSDLEALVARYTAARAPQVLVSPLTAELPTPHICCTVDGERLCSIVGLPMDPAGYSRITASALDARFLRYAALNSGIMSDIEVGMMPPLEGFLEASLMDAIRDGVEIGAVPSRGEILDVDKPWHALEANGRLVRRVCSSITGRVLGEGASVAADARLDGAVRLGKNSRIGSGVTVHGNLWVGDDTLIDNGAIIDGDCVVGDRSIIRDFCRITGPASVGSDCVVGHAAELEGMILDRVYLFHYMEFWGIIGRNTDLGAATVCGTLRFDNGMTTHDVMGRREKPRECANAVYLGDYCRTGVNAILMPGVMTGPYSVVGPGVVLGENLPDGTMVTVRQELERKKWGPARYGW
jgi:UDP-N-acetylglucosamine diphosphorylase / glucose-1-phosphate thymidylyltransferase / UDP-N-acetylgalactosamine diphosphorylase / glucosamine-1-phosphate N-acetyltransferase / galactosamine-1-phosphate N-acetyltransferase